MKIPDKKYIIIIVLLSVLYAALQFFIISPGVARAQETATATWEPMYKTPTPKSTEYYDCPQGTPIGYGSVTPNTWWKINCQNCMGTYTPTYSWQGTATPTPTVTMAVNKIRLQNVYGATWNEPLPKDYYPPSWMDQQVMHQYDEGSQIRIFLMEWCGSDYCNPSSTQKIYYKFECLASWHNPVPQGLVYGEVRFYTNNEVQFLRSYTEDCGTGNWGVCAVHGEGSFEANQLVNANLFVRLWARTSGWSEQDYNAGNGCNYQFSMSPIEPPIPPGSSYCSNVDGSGQEQGDPFSGLPVVRVGPATCGGIVSIDIDLSSWPIIGEIIPEIYFPGLNVCFSPVIFGSLDLLGISVNLDLLATIMAGVVAVRLFTRS